VLSAISNGKTDIFTLNVRGQGKRLTDDIFDDLIKTFYNITDDEYDYIADNASDDELHIFLSALGGLEKPSTFTERRKGLIMRNHYIEKYNSENKYEG
jgi:hypothetical protein